MLGPTTVVLASPVRVATVTDDFAAIARFIGGDKVIVQSLVKGSRDLHHVQPKPSMVMKVRRADVLFRLGMSQDSWVDGLIQVARNRKVIPGGLGYVDCSQAITHKIGVPTGHIDGRHGDVHAEGNPHYWLNPNNGKLLAKLVRDKLIQISPTNKPIFEANYDRFVEELQIKMKGWKSTLASYQNYQIVTYHKVWPYFFDAFGLTAVDYLEPLPGIPPTTKHLAALKTKLSQSDQPILVLMANYYPKKVGETFSDSMSARLVRVPTNVGDRGVRTYFDLFDTIVREIAQ